uniref:Elongation factor 1-delta n=1 Tax=Aotus nancymaae TaxID=37293 RepID=A0A2K5D2R9_AOTNA
MTTNFLVHEKIWFYKFKYDDAERRFYKQMNRPVAGVSLQENGTIWKWRTSLHGVVQELQQAVSKLEAWLHVLEKSSPTSQTQHVSPMRLVEPSTKKPATPAENEDDDIDLFGTNNEEEDKEAAQLREEWLQQYMEKKAKKPAPVAKSSILLDVKSWDDETDMAQLEACVHSIQLDGLVWGASKLVPVGYEITKFEEHVQRVNITAFNKI